MTSPSPIQDKAPKPPGLLPKNVQSWLLAGLAVLMVVIMWLTGGKKPPAPSRAIPAAPAVQAPLEVNEAKIVELQNRIQQLQREQTVAQNALAQQSRILGAGAQDPPAGVSGAASSAPPERAEDAIQAERKKRAYLSLFSSNVALTYRKSPQTAQAHEGETSAPLSSGQEPSAAQLAELMKSLQPQVQVPAQAPSFAQHKDSAAESDRKEETKSLPPRRLAHPPRRQARPTSCLKEPYSKPY